MKYNFPTSFWWGSASSATQSEGAIHNTGKGDSIWDLWFKEEPKRFFDGVSSENASTFYDNYKSDIQLMKETGHNSFRTSISWSRLIPEGTGDVNPKAVKFYNDVFDELITNDILPIICLYHFDMPVAMQEIGGWENKLVCDAYADYAKICFELFGNKVTHWFTFNEPIVPVECGYMYQYHYPNVVDFKRATNVAFNTMIAHAKAVNNFRQMKCNGKIGIILNLSPTYSRSESKEDLDAAHIADLIFNRSFLDPSVNGVYPTELVDLLNKYHMLPEYTQDEIEIIKMGTVDILGVNYYQPRRVMAKESPKETEYFMPEWLFDYYDDPNKVMNPHRGWEIYPKGIYDILTYLQKDYGNIDCYISENGMGVEGEAKFIENGQVQDTYRIAFLQDHLKWLHQALDNGSNCRGYHMWTFIDNWSWCNAYKNRYGFIRLDVETQKRQKKLSAEWFAMLSKNNGFN